MSVSLEKLAANIEAARTKIQPFIRRTPTLDFLGVNAALPFRLSLKLELLQVTGSFKPRGAVNRLLSLPEEERRRGVVAASGGNHGLGVAYAAKVLGVPAHIFVPTKAPVVKVEKIRALGATLYQTGEHYQQSLEASQQFAARARLSEVHAYDHEDVIAGQGTVGLELWEDRPDLDVLLVAVGGGGLLCGISAYFSQKSPKTRVLGVEPEGCPTLYEALRAGQPIKLERLSSVAADSLGAQRVGDLNLSIARDTVEGVVLVADDDIKEAQRFLWEELRLWAEPGGAAALAALLSRKADIPEGAKVGVLVCGANAPISFA